MPDIPGSRRPAENLMNLGQGLMQVGAAIGNIRTAQPAGAKALYDGSVYEETAQFKMSLDEGFNVWYANIQNDPNEATYVSRFQEDRNSILESALEGVTLPEARSKAMEYAAGEFDKYFENVAKLAQEKKVKKIEGTAIASANALATSGKWEELVQMTQDPEYLKIIPDDELKRVLSTVIPKAKQQSVMNELAFVPIEKAVALLQSGKFDDFLGSKEAQDLSDNYLSALKKQKELAESISEERGLKYWDEYDKKRIEGKFKDLHEMESYASLVDKSHREMVREDIERERADLGNGLMYEQDKRATSIISDMTKWSTSTPEGVPAPWDEAKVAELASQKYENGEPVLREDNLQTIKKAFDEIERLRDDPQSVAMYSQLYEAIDANKNPALAVTLKEIDNTIQDRAINTAIKAKRQELQQQYEAGINKTKESAEYEAAGVIFDVTKSQKYKRDWLAKNRDNFSGDDYGKWLGKIDASSGVNERTDIYTAINEYYSKEMGGPNTTTAQRKDLAVERYEALTSFEEYMMSTDDPNMWKQKLREFNDAKTFRKIEDEIEKKLGASYGGTVGVPATRREDIVESARELGILSGYPTEAKEYDARRESIQNRDQATVTKKLPKGITITSVTPATAKSEALYYSSDKKVYFVKYEKVGKDIVRVVYSADVGGTKWTRVGVE
jgi:hypothetical protein